MPTGSWAAFAAAWAILDGSGPFSLTATATFGFGEFQPAVLNRGIVQVFVDGPGAMSTSTISVWFVGPHVLLDGFAYDSQNDEYFGTVTLSDNDVSRFEVRPFSFDDARMDVDANGRFNNNDVVELIGRIGSTDSDDVPFFDFDGSGAISQADVEFLANLVANGFDSGILGDYDRDGDADCDDLSAMGSGWNYIIGDANYRVEIDADLDGDNDSTDYDAVYDILQPADINDDGLVNTQDMTAYLILYAALDPAADLNGDGIVNTQDFVLFLNLWNNPC